jgi:hypothetical protein
MFYHLAKWFINCKQTYSIFPLCLLGILAIQLYSFMYVAKISISPQQTVNLELGLLIDWLIDWLVADWFRFMVFNATFNNISVITWWSGLLVKETGVLGENHRPVTDNLYHIMLYWVHLAMNGVRKMDLFYFHWFPVNVLLINERYILVWLLNSLFLILHATK